MIPPQSNAEFVCCMEHILDLYKLPIDYAHQMKYVVDERYPQAEKIGVIQDQLNTGSLNNLVLYLGGLLGESERKRVNARKFRR